MLLSQVTALALTLLVCDASFVNITAWRSTIKYQATSKNGATHTLDLFNGPAEGCAPHPMTDSERKLVVKVHNDLRRKVAKGEETRGLPGPQPKAANMIKMQYDQNLEKVALAWISQCKPGHDKYRDIDGYRFVGQNGASEGSTAPLKKVNWEKYIRSNWYNEVKLFNGTHAVTKYTGRNPSAKGSVGHYAQVVTARARRVGCGQATFRKGKWYMRRAVCNYGDGVLLDAPLYRGGEPCTSPSDKDCDDGLLIG